MLNAVRSFKSGQTIRDYPAKVGGLNPLCSAWPGRPFVSGVTAYTQTVLSCPYCGNSDHQALVSLVPEHSAKSAIDACKLCLGYVKVFTTLQGAPPEAVILEGYRLPRETGY